MVKCEGKLKFISAGELLKMKFPAREYKYVQFIKQRNSIMVDGSYEIELSRCQSAKACLDWIHQLHEKPWFTVEMHEEFIDILLKKIPTKLWAGGLNE